MVFVAVSAAISGDSNLPSFDCNVDNIELYALSVANSTFLYAFLAKWSGGNISIKSVTTLKFPELFASLTKFAQLVKFASSGPLVAFRKYISAFKSCSAILSQYGSFVAPVSWPLIIVFVIISTSVGVSALSSGLKPSLASGVTKFNTFTSYPFALKYDAVLS